MHGNVHEWCADGYAADYGGLGSVRDPKGPTVSPKRVHRGGSFLEPFGQARSAARHPQIPNVAAPNLGFRVVCTISTEKVGEDAIALRLMTQRIAAHPNFAGHYNERGFFYMRQRDFDKAIADFTELIRLKEQIPALNGYHHRANAYQEKGEFELALADLTRAIEWAPENFTLYHQRAAIHDRLHQPDKAAEDRRLAREREMDGHAKRIRDLSQQISRDNKVASYQERAWHYMHFKQYIKAFCDFNELIRRRDESPPDRDAFFERGRAYAMMGDFAKAAEDFTRAIDRNPREPEYYNHRRKVYEELNERDKAAADAAKMRELREKAGK
jgi:tetratricopeptide (TPR) repeat protein